MQISSMDNKVDGRVLIYEDKTTVIHNYLGSGVNYVLDTRCIVGVDNDSIKHTASVIKVDTINHTVDVAFHGKVSLALDFINDLLQVKL